MSPHFDSSPYPHSSAYFQFKVEKERKSQQVVSKTFARQNYGESFVIWYHFETSRFIIWQKWFQILISYLIRSEIYVGFSKSLYIDSKQTKWGIENYATLGMYHLSFLFIILVWREQEKPFEHNFNRLSISFIFIAKYKKKRFAHTQKAQKSSQTHWEHK